jgi:hypothetical protein
MRTDSPLGRTVPISCVVPSTLHAWIEPDALPPIRIFDLRVEHSFEEFLRALRAIRG